MALLVVCSVIALFSQLSTAQPKLRNYTSAMVHMNTELPKVYDSNLNLTAYIYKRQMNSIDFPTYDISHRTNITDAADLTCDNAKLRASPGYGCPAWFNTEHGSMPDFMVAEGGFNDTAWAGFVQGTKVDPTHRVLVTHVNERTSETVKDNHETIINDYVQFSSRGIDCNASDFVVRLEYCRSDNIVVRLCVTENRQVNTPDVGPQLEDPHDLCTDLVSKLDTGIGTHETRGCFNSNVTLSNATNGIMNMTGLSSRPFRIVIMVKNGAQASSVVPENIVVIKSISAMSPTCPPPTTTTSTTTSTSTSTSTTTTTTEPTTTTTTSTTTTHSKRPHQYDFNKHIDSAHNPTNSAYNTIDATNNHNNNNTSKFAAYHKCYATNNYQYCATFNYRRPYNFAPNYSTTADPSYDDSYHYNGANHNCRAHNHTCSNGASHYH